MYVPQVFSVMSTKSPAVITNYPTSGKTTRRQMGTHKGHEVL